MTYFVLTRRLRSQDIAWLEKTDEAKLIVLGQALLSDFGAVKSKMKVFALQEEVKETGLVPQYEGEVELKVAGDLADLMLEAQLIHL